MIETRGKNQQMKPEADLLNGDDAEIDSEYLPAGTALLNGQYVIESYLSSGGFGITYLARDSLDRPVVIKECYPEALCSRKNKTVRARSTGHANEFQSLVGMFMREARNIAKLQHPNIVGVHQIFEDNHTAYMALDLIKGQDLLQILEDNPEDLTPRKIQSLMAELLDAIAAVHDQDMLHRDISPDNILLDPWGKPILIDFGAAREHASKKSRAISAFLVVKDGYSPQEFYISGGQQGPSSDLYSLAATFFHVITGDAPPNSQTRIAAIAGNRPDPYDPLAGRIQGYDAGFLEAIDLAMQVFPTDRMQSAQEWLDMISGARPVSVQAPSPAARQDMQKIISELVSANSLSIEEENRSEPQSATPAPEPAPAIEEPVWEYLSVDEEDELEYDDDATEHAQTGFDERLVAIAPPPPPPDPRIARKRRRKLALLVLGAALAFNVYESPDENLVTMAVPELQSMIESSKDLKPRISNFFTAYL